MGAGYRRVIAQKSDQAAVLKSCRFPETAGTENVLVNSANCFELALSTPAQNWMWKQAEIPLVVVAAAVVVVVVARLAAVLFTSTHFSASRTSELKLN